MFQPENQIYVMKNELVNVISSTILRLIFLAFFSFFLFFSEVLFAAPLSSESEAIFDSKLDIAVKNISTRLLENESEVVVAVVDLVNYETQERDSRADALEEQLTNLLYEIQPNQVVPYFEIVYLRLEWKSRFPDILHGPLTEDIAKLTDADWLLTGTHKTIGGLLYVSLKLYDLKSGNLLWQTVVGSERTAGNEEAESVLEEMLTEKIEQKSSELPFQQTAQVHVPNFSTPSQYRSLEQEAGVESKVEFPPVLIPPSVEENVAKIPQAMLKISAGEFLMGSDLGDEDELPDHLVFIQSFYLDQHEVTNEEYSKCLTCERGHGGFDTIDPQQPVVYVDWKNAAAFCKAQNKRLPTEAEWEYAAKAGSETEYSYGSDISLLDNYAWLETNTVDLGLWGAKNVSTKQANQWGVFDLHGNVMEWVQNYYTQDYFSSVRQPNNPKGPIAPLDEKYPLRVVRGGAWGGRYAAGTPAGLRSAKRYAFVEWTRSFQIGFRCAKDVHTKIVTYE